MQFSALRTRVARRILGLFVLCALVPIGALAIVMYQHMSRLVAAQARERLELASKGAGLDLFRRFHDVDAQLRAGATGILAWRTGQKPPQIPEGMLSRLAVQRTPGASPLFVMGSADSVPPLPPQADRHLASGRPVLVSVGERLWLARSGEPAEPGALLWAELGADYVWDSAGTGGTLTEGMSLCVLHRGGLRLHCPRAPGQGDPPLDAIGKARVSGFLEFDTGGERQLGAWWPLFLRYQFLADDLLVFVSQPRAVALAAMSDFRWTFVPAVLLALWLVLLLVYVQVRRTTAPLGELRTATQRVSALDFTQPVAIRSGDEFEDVAHSFNNMATRLQDQFAERDRLTAAVQQTSDALRESEQRLRAILETAPDGVVTADAEGIIEEFNRTAERLFGYVREEVVGRPVSVLLSEGEHPGTFHTGERRARRKDESAFPVELGVSETQVGSKTIYTGFVHDITERRRQEAEQAKLEAQLRQTQKMDTIGTLAGGIAHDFNNILTGVLGYVDLAIAGTPPDAPTRKDMQEVRAAAERAKALVRQILAFSRKADTQPQPVDLDGLVTEARALLRASIPATIDVRVTTDPDTPIVNADPTQLHQVIMNLGTNAYHAMRDADHGTLDIDVRLVTLPAPHESGLASVTLPAGRYACISVRDTGHGMDPATLERIFEPFFTTKPVGEGTGLGLSVVHGIVTRHGGTIAVDSTVGVGTVFRIVLPAGEGDEGVTETAADWTELRGTGQVLVVDDDPAIAGMVSRVLGQLGYAATVAGTGKAAVETVLRDPHRFELVITDLTMPGLTGDKVGAALRKVRPDLRLLLMTGQADKISSDRYQAWGFHGLLIKPLGARAVAEAVQRVFQSSPTGSNA